MAIGRAPALAIIDSRLDDTSAASRVLIPAQSQSRKWAIPEKDTQRRKENLDINKKNKTATEKFMANIFSCGRMNTKVYSTKNTH